METQLSVRPGTVIFSYSKLSSLLHGPSTPTSRVE